MLKINLIVTHLQRRQLQSKSVSTRKEAKDQESSDKMSFIIYLSEKGAAGSE